MIVLKAAQEKILGALQAVSGIVERRHTLPILANVLLRKTGGRIEFTTSDLEIQVPPPPFFSRLERRPPAPMKLQRKARSLMSAIRPTRTVVSVMIRMS